MQEQRRLKLSEAAAAQYRGNQANPQSQLDAPTAAASITLAMTPMLKFQDSSTGYMAFFQTIDDRNASCRNTSSM